MFDKGTNTMPRHIEMAESVVAELLNSYDFQQQNEFLQVIHAKIKNARLDEMAHLRERLEIIERGNHGFPELQVVNGVKIPLEF